MIRQKTQLYNELCRLAGQPGVISFVGSLPDCSLLKMNYGEFEKATKNAFAHHKYELMQLAPVGGIFHLRNLLEQWYGGHVVVTNGSQQAFSLLASVLLGDGGSVVVEPFSYIGIEKPLRQHGGVIRALSGMINCMEVGALEQEIKAIHPKMMYVESYFANPTGESIDVDKLVRLRLLAKKYHFYLIEDQIYGWLDESYPFGGRDGLENNTWVIQLSSVSKIIAAGLRVGWIVVRDRKLIEQILLQKETMDLSTSTLDQEIVYELFSRSDRFETWRKKMREAYKRRMDVLLLGMSAFSCDVHFQPPDGGCYVWVRGPSGFNASRQLIKALECGVSYVPGNLFAYGDARCKDTFRLSVSSITEKEIERGMARLRRVLDGAKR